MTTRRRFLTGAAGLPLALAGVGLEPADAQEGAARKTPTPAPKYTLSINLEMMFAAKMSWEERLTNAQKAGAKAYSFWAFEGKNLPALRTLGDKYGMTCASITGANKTGWGDGLTKTGQEAEFLADFREAVAAAKIVGATNLITFVGKTQTDIPWETQYAQIIAGLRRAGDTAGEADVYLTLEPLNIVESPQMAVITARRGFDIVKEVAHPRVKVDFDMYHLQLGEGNLTNHLREGLRNGYIRFVEVGDVPGRFEPGTGESNYPHLFRVLREEGYAGYIGMEHRASKTPREAFETVRKLAGL